MTWDSAILLSSTNPLLEPGLADLNCLDLNHRFKSPDFFIKISDLNQFLFFFKLRTNQSCFG